MDKFDKFYFDHGIRRVGEVTAPRLFQLSDIVLPRYSIWHYFGTPDSPLPEESHPYLSEARHVLTEHVTEYSDSDPAYIKRKRPLSPIVAMSKGVHKLTPDIKLLRRDINSVSDPNTIILESYGLIQGFIEYKDKPLAQVFKNYDLINTAINKINSMSDTERQHFISVSLDERVPPLSAFKRVAKKEDRVTLLPFSNFGNYFVMQLFLSMSDNGIFVKKVSKGLSERINFIFDFNGKCLIINLKKLITWAMGEDKDLDNKEFRLRFLRMMLILTEDDGSESEDDDDLVDTDEKESSSDPEEAKETEGPDDSIEDQLELRDKFLETNEEVNLDEIDIYRPPSDDNYYLELVKNGTYTPAEISAIRERVSKQGSVKNPWGAGELKDILTISQEQLAVKEDEITFADKDVITDKGQLKSSLDIFDKKYIEEIMTRDIANVLTGFSGAGLVITDIERTDVSTAVSEMEEYRVRVNLHPGKASTISFTLPKINDQGIIYSGGVKYYLKKQFTDMPIRKIRTDRVSLTSAMGKLFVNRLPHNAWSYDKWLTAKIVEIVTDDQDDRVTKANTATVFNSKQVTPTDLAVISQTFEKFTIKHTAGPLSLVFKDLKERNDGLWEVGVQGNNPVLMDNQSKLIVNGTSLGSIPEIIGLDISKAPVGTAVVNIYGKSVPLAIVLGFKLGISKLVKTLGVSPRIVPKGGSLNLQPDEYRIRFADQSWVFNRNDKTAALILSGFNYYRKVAGKYDLKLFNKPDVYMACMKEMGLERRYHVEIDVIYDMFIDHITKELLIEMNEPTDMVSLYIRSAELLTTHQHPDEMDMEYMRIRGYERVPMAIYQELVKSIRGQRLRGGTKQQGLEMHPKAVWMSLFTDTSKEVFGEINPLHSLKQKEGVTFGGTGGRDTQTMTKSTRAFHPSHRGLISESTPDSGKVGVVVNMVANPNFKSLRGKISPYDLQEKDFNKLMGTSALITPGIEHDDPKRILFASVQNSHAIPCTGYKVAPLITGAEASIGNRTDPLFATTAKKSGKVVKVTDKSITIEYKDSSTQVIEIGKRYADESGEVTAHSIVTKLKLGDKVSPGDTLAYNEYWFNEDPVLGLVLKFGSTAKVVFMESPDNFEDSVLIHQRLANQMKSPGVIRRDIIVNFSQDVANLVKVNQEVQAEDPLAIIYEAVGDDTSLYEDNPEALEILRSVGSSSPRARYAGKVSRIEVYYRGEKDDMADGLLTQVQFYEGRMIKDRLALGLSKVSSQVDDTFRINGNTLATGQAIFRIYLEYDKSCGLGDKLVFGAQMKCTVGDTLTGVFQTASGTPIDASFSNKSVANRIVSSITLQGLANTLCYKLADRALDIYLNGED